MSYQTLQKFVQLANRHLSRMNAAFYAYSLNQRFKLKAKNLLFVRGIEPLSKAENPDISDSLYVDNAA